MLFITILFLTTLSIAGSAAFFSIYGLAQIFAGSFWPVVAMASSLEAGKLVAASFVYRYWRSISVWMKIYLITAILLLMGITSAGVFGFLSAAYQQDMIDFKTIKQQIQLLNSEKEELLTLKQERLERKKQIDKDIASLPNNFITGRQRLLGDEGYGPELKQLNNDITNYSTRIREITLEISKLKQQNLTQEAHVGPIIFIAKVFDQQIDDTTKWLILIIIFAFDPLAVVLTIGTNFAFLQYKSKNNNQTDKKTLIVDEQGLSKSDIRALLQEMSQQQDLTPAELAQKTILEEMLRRKEITESLRNPSKS